MSLESVQQFLDKVSKDQFLQEELAKALEAENDRDAVTALARTQGYNFSAEELWAEVQKRQNQFQAEQTSKELSDEELEAVAGGGKGQTAGAAVLTPAAAPYTITKHVVEKVEQAKW